MASRVPRDMSPEVIDPQILGELFVRQYYFLLQNYPEVLHKLYKRESVLVRPGPHGAMETATTLQGIKDMILSSDYKGCSVNIASTDIQASAMGGIHVTVTGDLIGNGKDNLRKTFLQTFFVVKQELVTFILSDTLQFMEAHESLLPPSSNGTDANALNVPLSHDQEVMQNKKESDAEDTVAEVSNPPLAPSKMKNGSF